jgi:hypothetical protein
MSKLYIVLDSEHRMNEMGFNEGGCSVWSTYEEALQSAHKEHARPYGSMGEEDCPHYDYQILIVEKIGHSVNQREVYLPRIGDLNSKVASLSQKVASQQIKLDRGDV